MVKRVKLNSTAVAVKKQSGRPTSYKPEYNLQTEKLCRLGWTNKDLADFFDVAIQTILNWKHDYPEFFRSLRKGKLDADTKVAGCLYKNATGFYYYEEELKPLWHERYEGKGKNKQLVARWQELKVVEVKKYFKPDTTAQIFFLKNRRPEHWRDVVSALRKEENERVQKTEAEVKKEIKARNLTILEGVEGVDYKVVGAAK